LKLHVVNNPPNPTGRIYIYRSAEIGYQQKLTQLHATRQAGVLSQSVINLQKVPLTQVRPDDTIHLGSEKSFRYFAQVNDDDKLKKLRANLNIMKQARLGTPKDNQEEHANLDREIPTLESLIQQRIQEVIQKFLDDKELQAAISIDRILEKNQGYTL